MNIRLARVVVETPLLRKFEFRTAQLTLNKNTYHQ